MKRLTAWILLLVLAVSCASKTAPSAPPASPGNNLVATWPYIFATILDNGTKSISVQIADVNGPVTDAAVTLSYSEGSRVLSYTGPGTYLPVTVNGNYVIDLVSAEFGSNSLNYTPGESCTLTAAFDGKTYSSAITTMGGAALTVVSGNMIVSWPAGGIDPQIVGVANLPFSNGVTFTSPASPVTIQTSQLTPCSCAYTVRVSYPQTQSVFTGLNNSSNMVFDAFYSSPFGNYVSLP